MNDVVYPNGTTDMFPLKGEDFFRMLGAKDVDKPGDINIGNMTLTLVGVDPDGGHRYAVGIHK